MIDDLPFAGEARPQLVVFDIAGTIIEDGDQVPDAFRGALHAQQVAVTAAELEPWRGASKREVLRAFLERHYGTGDPGNAARLEQAYADFRQRLEAGYRDGGVTPIPGAEATFAWLRERGIRLALTTGFYRQVADLILEAAGWQRAPDAARGQGFFDATVCSDEVAQGRPAPYMIFRVMEATGVTDVRRVATVGDTALDLLAGTHAGLRWVVGVLSGSQEVETLGAAPHTHLLPSVAMLPRLWP
jgi:phosphonatase-like hydrolase